MSEDMMDGTRDDWEQARSAAAIRARELKEQASKGGLRFDAYLPPRLAEWLLDLIERGVFLDPSEAVFVILGEHHDLEPHTDLKQELLRRMIQASIDDPRPSIPAKEVFENLRRQAAELRDPASWTRPPRLDRPNAV
jgi:antitoxin ParD1/3/4